MPTGHVSPGTLTMMRHASEAEFTHTYTRESRVVIPDDPLTVGIREDLDEWRLPTTTYQAPVSGVPCIYLEKLRINIQPLGPQVVDEPRLLVKYTDSLEPGDRVSNITNTRNGTIVLAGPVMVEELDRNADAELYHVAKLRDVRQV